MALGDFSVVNSGISPQAKRYITKANNTAIKAGEPVLKGTAGDVEYVTVAADASDTDDVWVGIAASADTVTASADGEVYVYDDASVVYRGQAVTPGNLADTILNTKVTLELTNGVFEVDEDDTTKGVLLVKGYDASAGTVDFMISQGNTLNN